MVSVCRKSETHYQGKHAVSPGYIVLGLARWPRYLGIESILMKHTVMALYNGHLKLSTHYN